MWQSLKNADPAVKAALIGAVATVVVGLIAGAFLLASKTPTTGSIPTPTTNPTHAPTATIMPTVTNNPSILYHADFTQGSQEWLDNGHSSQWTYNATDKALEANGSEKCCDTQASLQNIALNAPYTSTGNYAVEARIKVTGLNSNNPYVNRQPPFFGLYLRGLGLNKQGYMAGVLAFTPNEPNSSPLSYLLVTGSTVPDKLIDYLEKNYALDTQWHTYRIEARGNTFTFFIDGTQLYQQTVENYFGAGPQVGLEDYDYNLQIQNFTVYQL